MTQKPTSFRSYQPLAELNLQFAHADAASDYHLNINLRMNFWPADVANLSETIDSLVDWFEPLTERGRESARILYGTDGWLAYHATNPFGRVTGSGSNTRSQFNNGFADPLAGAWMAMPPWHLTSHPASKSRSPKKEVPCARWQPPSEKTAVRCGVSLSSTG